MFEKKLCSNKYIWLDIYKINIMFKKLKKVIFFSCVFFSPTERKKKRIEFRNRLKTTNL